LRFESIDFGSQLQRGGRAPRKHKTQESNEGPKFEFCGLSKRGRKSIITQQQQQSTLNYISLPLKSLREFWEPCCWLLCTQHALSLAVEQKLKSA